MPRIDSIYAFVAEESGPDDEGIIGAKTTEGWMPLVGVANHQNYRLRCFGTRRE